MRDRARGTLVLVVGPSGAGKDTLLAAARAQREPGNAFNFPTREITRAADAGGEIHREVTRVAFDAKRAAGGYALSWDAHGLGYGFDAAILAALAAGQHVVCNVSRAVVDEARARFQPVRVVRVTASPQVLAQRLAARGRETVTEVEARLRRAATPDPNGPDVTIVTNDGPLEVAVAAFQAALGSVAAR